ncbi:hypothetical protein CEE44_01270 [Candidatus Woesearchaeota archaeon B3_Woes]|nr:MAG: hypothetical protein CEE44_01270 [Candidatus Woesearchaeota archaeon B3_Woes]
MNNQQPVTKEEATKIVLKVIVGAIAFTVIFMFLAYGKIPVKPLLIALAIMVPIMVVSGIMGYKHQPKIRKKSKTIPYVFIILGSLMVIVYVLQLFMIGKTPVTYLNIVVGFVFLFIGVYKLKKSQ